MKQTLILHAAQVVTPTGTALQKGQAMGKLTVIPEGAVYIEEGIIQLVGPTEEVMAQLGDRAESAEKIDAAGQCVLPGFVDSHTHFIFGGYRPDEFIMRLEGAQYLDIMKMGGGIQSTVNATKACTAAELKELGKARLRDMLAQGVTTVEGKSGYGLDMDCELTQLQVMKELEQEQPVEIARTYLGGHAVPKGFPGGADAYVDYMTEQVLPRVAEGKLADFCDVFCEEGVFTIDQSRRLLLAGKALGLASKIHADEIVPLGGGELAAEVGAVSADHLLAVSDQGIADMAAKDVVSTLLPCTAFCLAKPYAPARKMIDAGCGVALASDFNPGSCFADSIPLMLALAVIHMKMTIEEAITAMTLNGAAAVGWAQRIGSLEPGKQADVVFLKFPSYKFLVYHTGANIVKKVMKKGKMVYEA